MDTMISRQAFGLLWLNPPYGDLARDTSGNLGYEGKGRARLEKLFYQRMLPLLQYGGILVFILPSYVLDQEMVGWLTRHFADLSVFQAVDKQFKQVVVFGRRVRQRSEEHTSELQSLMRISYAVFCLKKKKQNLHHTYHVPISPTTATTLQ